jgi:putative hemolysin
MDIYGLVFRVVLLVFLLMLSGFFSASETAVTSLNHLKVKQMQQKKVKGTGVIVQLVNKSNRILSTTLLGNNLANTAATAIATELVVQIFGGAGVTALVTLVMTALILIFGEITPKTYASHNSEMVALKLGRALIFLSAVLYPLLKALNLITSAIIRIFGGEIRSGVPFVTEEEIRTLLKVGHEEGLIREQESEMIDSIFEFDDTYVNEVMVPRIDVVAVDISSGIEDVMDIVTKSGFSRIPVYEGNIDNVVGIIYVKDLIRVFREGEREMNIAGLMKEPYYVPESKKLNDLLREMRKEKVHIAIVLDQYGGTAGLVTIEDLVEEIVGEINDEFDVVQPHVVKNDDGSYTVSGRVPVEELRDEYKMGFPGDEYQTIGGLVFNRLGRLPHQGDKVRFGNTVVEVTRVQKRRIIEMKVYPQQNKEV